jgi:hypothetical protein
VVTFQLNRRPARSDSHHYADWIELCVLRSGEGEFSRADAIQRLLETYEVDGPPDDDVELDAELIEAVAPGQSATQARANRHVEDAIRQIERRVQDFAAAYPFVLSADRDVITKRRSSKERSTYIALLLASSKKWISGANSDIEQTFEVFTANAVTQWLGGGFVVHGCGTAAAAGTRYERQPMPQKLRKLSEDLRAPVAPDGGNHFRAGDSGDGGLDVVAWKSPIDQANGNLAVFVQATTAARFDGKWGDVQDSKWRQRLAMKSAAVPVLAVPFAFRDTAGGWYMPAEIQSVLLDRLRLVRLIGKDPSGRCSALNTALL